MMAPRPRGAWADWALQQGVRIVYWYARKGVDGSVCVRARWRLSVNVCAEFDVLRDALATSSTCVQYMCAVHGHVVFE